jgi:hypothetical protein
MNDIYIEDIDPESLGLCCKPWNAEDYLIDLECVKTFIKEFCTDDVHEEEFKQALEICLRAKAFRE